MLHIMPTSDLKENFAKIQDLVVDQAENVYLTQNGYGSMVIMNLETYEKLSDGVATSSKPKNKASRKINITGPEIIDD